MKIKATEREREREILIEKENYLFFVYTLNN
jgi:hypothetical protein